MNLKQFKIKYRIKSDDIWSDAMEAWFECAGWLNYHGENIPSEWGYFPGMGDGREPV